MTGKYIDFQTGHFANFERFKIDSHFANFEQVKIDPDRSFVLILGRSQFKLVWARRQAAKNNSNPLGFAKKNQEPRSGSDRSPFQELGS